MSTKHTPGPWAYALEYGPTVTEPPCITTVAHCANYVIGLPSEYPGGNYRDGDPSGDEEADARLIAAAPDLLEALKDALKFIENDEVEWAQQFDCGNKARDAIAKATGEAK